MNIARTEGYSHIDFGQQKFTSMRTGKYTESWQFPPSFAPERYIKLRLCLCILQSLVTNRALLYKPYFTTMQRATHPSLHVRDARDAHTVFEAVRQGLLRPISRRLNEVERQMHIRSGGVFVWEEHDDESGLKRWTGRPIFQTTPSPSDLIPVYPDGRVWGQSRMREVISNLIFYSIS